MWALAAGVVAAILGALVAGAGVARAAPEVQRYEPASVAPGEVVTLHGAGFGTRKPEHSVRYGTDGAPLAPATILAWSSTSIRVSLPPLIRPGTYWLAIYENDRLRSNRLRTLRVATAAAGALGAKPGFDLGERMARERDIRPAAGLDLAIEAINPGIGSTVSPVDGKLTVWVTVRTLRGSATPFVVTAPGPGGRPASSGVAEVPEGHSIPVPIEIGVHPNQIRNGMFRTTVAIGTPRNPMAFKDDNIRNNSFEVRYRVPPDLLPVRVLDVTAHPAGGVASQGRTVVTLLVRNEGPGPAPASRISLRDVAAGTGRSECAKDGPVVFDVPLIGPGATISGRLPLACNMLRDVAGREIEVVMDPGDQVRESDEGNNALRAPLSSIPLHTGPPYTGWARSSDWNAAWGR